ncbi:MAG: DUF190 domain-containing protein [Epsilonproteobacteria bacterium]|nr:DUF190 domain-containing protein [Campylobacterota bacterium]
MKRFLGSRKRVRIYLDSGDTYEGRPLWEHLLTQAQKEGMTGATVYKAVAGFGAHSEIRTFNVWSLSQNLPLIVEMVDEETKIRGFLQKADAWLNEAFVTMEEVEVIAYKHPGHEEA